MVIVSLASKPSSQGASDPEISGNGTKTVHDILRKLVLDGTLAPGSEITQLDLSRRLSVSRTPLREALRLLEREGLVVSAGPHRSVRISSLSMRDLDDLYALRVMGEGLATWLTVPMLRREDFEQLDADVERIANRDAEAHERFHACLRQGASGRLREQMAQLFDHAERYQRVLLRQEIDDEAMEAKVDEHRRIVEACKARDRERARELMVDHIASTAIALMTAERHAPFVLPEAVAMAKAGGGFVPSA
ncbi:GntR family transcriptional regulator [Yinghuangia aomiensis]|uniref:GntR family transcriptional regulator n=1 Tax=Yinghuangia aomiensis TaxID=676205 RepID=A0ABP9HU73_9ACTN